MYWHIGRLRSVGNTSVFLLQLMCYNGYSDISKVGFLWEEIQMFNQTTLKAFPSFGHPEPACGAFQAFPIF